MRIDIGAPIVPGESLGAIHLGTNVREVRDPLFEASLPEAGAYTLLTPFQAWYRLAGERVGMHVDVRTGTIFKLSAYQGYTGTLFGRVSVGMTAREAMAADSRLYYDPGNDLVLCEHVGGIELELSVDDPDPREVPSLPIVGISIWDPDLLLAATRR
jgi:hypothetical protein